MISQVPPSLADLVNQLVDLTAVEPAALFSQGEQAVRKIDLAASAIWSQIVCQITEQTDPMIGLQQILFLVPDFMPLSQSEIQRACIALQVNFTNYVRSRIDALSEIPPTVSAAENLKHTIIGIKAIYGNVLAVQRHLRNAG